MREFFQGNNGKLSMMRLQAFIASVCGALCILCGCYAALRTMPQANELLLTGGGLLGGAIIGKGWQRGNENAK